MSEVAKPAVNSPALTWTGRVISALPVLLLLFRGYQKTELVEPAVVA